MCNICSRIFIVLEKIIQKIHFRSSTEPIAGFVDDYSFVIRGLLDLYEACYDARWLEWAEQLQQKQNDLFWDSEGGGYYSTDASAKNIIIRMKEGERLSFQFSSMVHGSGSMISKTSCVYRF